MLKTLIATALTTLSIGSVFADVSYSTFNYPDAAGGSTFLTGIRKDGSGVPGNVYITGVYTPVGTSNTSALLYRGPITQNTGTWEVLNYTSPDVNVISTALYSPNDLGGNDVRAVGNYKIEIPGETTTWRDIGLMYESVGGVSTWTTLDATALNATTINTIAHSTHGGLVVGNYDTNLATGKAFVYNISGDSWFNLELAGAQSITAYGIWHNGGTSYTIAGGYSVNPSDTSLDQGYIVDFDSSTNTTANLRTYSFDNRPLVEGVTHFDGITSDGNGGYNLTGDFLGAGAANGIAFFASVSRTELGGFGEASWTQISYPSGSGLNVDVTSGNSVYENYVIGIYTANDEGIAQGYVAAVPEPTTSLLLIAAGGAVLALRKRRAV